MATWRRGFNVISTEERVKPERSGEIPHGRKKYRSEAIVFAPARSLDYARDDEARGAFRLVCGRTRASAPTSSTEGKDLKTGVRPYHALPKVSKGIADLPAGAPCRRDEGVPPYRGDLTPAKVSLYSNGTPLGGRGTPLPRSVEGLNTGVAALRIREKRLERRGGAMKIKFNRRREWIRGLLRT